MTTTPAPFSVLVNTSDGYEDCWGPFFRLFFAHWPDCPAPILLNTERKEWVCPQRTVRCARVAETQPAGWRGTWSECLLAALKQIETPLVLYLQEDYFIHQRVDAAAIQSLAAEMIRDPSIRHIGLTSFGAAGPFAPTSDPRLWMIARESRYRISTQAGLWRTAALKSYLEPDENAWMFEIFGTVRARLRNERFLTASRDYYGPAGRIVDYLHTGIIKGRWHPGIPEVFRAGGIDVDFSRRGFYRQPGWLYRKVETASKLISNPHALLRTLRARAADIL